MRKDGKLVAVSWAEAFEAVRANWSGEAAVIAGDQVDCETMFAARELAGSAMLEGRQTGLAYDTSSLSAVNFNTTIAGIENADVILLVGSDTAARSAAGEHAHPEGCAQERREGVCHRACDRPDL